MKKSLNLKYLIFILLVYLFIFQNILQTFFVGFKYLDEILALLSIPIIVVNICKSKWIIKLKNNNLSILVCLILIFISGIIGNIKYKYQIMQLAFGDALLVFKFFMIYYLAKQYFNGDFINDFRKKIQIHIKINIIILFILTILNYIYEIWPSSYRYGVMSNCLFYDHPSCLAAICIFLLGCLFLVTNNIKKNILEIIMLLVILLTTLRLKAIAAAFIITIMIIYVLITKKKLNLAKFAVIGIFALIIAFDQVSYYYLESDDSARKQLSLKSIEIAKDYLPIGTGFGTYGSYMSAVNYSNVYYLYNLSEIHGLQEGNTVFVSDTFWPMILGQFGLIGVISYILCLYIIYKEIQDGFNKENIYGYVSKMICLGYLLIASTSESAFVNPVAIPLAFIIGINLCDIKNKEEKNIIERKNDGNARNIKRSY